MNLIQFNTETVDYPKFTIYDANMSQSFNNGYVTIVLFDGEIKEKIMVDTIIDMYAKTQNMEYIMANMEIPFSFLLVDLDIHKPEYRCYVVIQLYDFYSYRLTLNMTIVKEDGGDVGGGGGNVGGGNVGVGGGNVGGGDGNVGGGREMSHGQIHLFTLNEKVISNWKYDGTGGNFITPPPFYISYGDFLQFMTDEFLPHQKPTFFFEILSKHNAITDETTYNYVVERDIKRCRFTLGEYVINQAAIKFYLLIYPKMRFDVKDAILDFIKGHK